MDNQNKNITDYDTALSFCHAAKILFKLFTQALNTLNYKDFSLFIPFMVNCSFACELFLKALIDKPQKGHNLSDLFKRLLEVDIVTARSIKKTVIESFNASNKPLLHSFEDELTSMKKTFEQFRYMHEPNMIEPHAYNYLFLYIFMVILEAHAEMKFGKRPIQNGRPPFG